LAEEEDCTEGFSALERIEEHLLSTKEGASVCLVCLETIGAADATWHCRQSCFAVMHLQCIQSWAQQQLTSARARAEERRRLFPNEPAGVDVSWDCPKCRQPYPPGEVPCDYFCFCGKERDPEFDPWKVPHSCGEVCGRHLQTGCSHTCVLLCHPGPCPPCPRMVDMACHCGRSILRQRCGRAAFSCGGPCGKALPCGHRCPEACHVGECPPCMLEDEHRCRCGRERCLLACSERDWSCGRVCGELLPCGRHRCEKGCHAGPCGTCGLEGERRCPCGRAVFRDLPCDAPAPTCGETCGRLLPCGIHTCAERCHPGPCPQTCRKMVVKSCNCGKTEKEVPCFTEVRCDRRCPRLRACGRHTCKRRCCDGDCPPCPETCGRRLRCGNHRCSAPCHSGSCLPCPLTATVSCACGSSKFTVPCGSEKKVAPPSCRLPCRVQMICRHRGVREPHACHYGPCPPCPHPCGTALGCGHTCASASCHDSAPPAVPSYVPRAPSAAGGQGSQGQAARALPPALEAARECPEPIPEEALRASCGPCMQPVEVKCHGGHWKVPMPCSEAAAFSCGQPCGAALPCGNHSCGLPCHDGSSACQECRLPCQRARPCGHPCPLPCHPGECGPCTASVERACYCGKTQIKHLCSSVQGETQGRALGLFACEKACHKQLRDCPHACKRRCHEGACEDGQHTCAEPCTIKCPCRQRKEKRPCWQIRASLRKLNRPARLVEGEAPVLLECNAKCRELARRRPAAAARAPAGGRPPARSKEEEGGQEDAPAQAAKSKEEKRREREERRLARLAAQEKAEAQRAFRQRMSLLFKVLCSLLAAALSVAFGYGLFVVAGPGEL